MRLHEYIKKLQQIAEVEGPDICVLTEFNPQDYRAPAPCVDLIENYWLPYVSSTIVKEFNLREGDKVLWL